MLHLTRSLYMSRTQDITGTRMSHILLLQDLVDGQAGTRDGYTTGLELCAECRTCGGIELLLIPGV